MSRKPNFENDAAEDDGNVGSPPSRSSMNESKIALFIDFENIAIGVADAKFKKFEVALLLERLLEKGKIVVKRAYSDWDKFPDYKRELHEAAIELIEIPGRVYSGKNSADIRMVVDALDLCYTKPHVDTFVIISGDSDFSPLVSKLRENNKGVIGMGVKNSTSDLLIANCDEFIYYDDLVREQAKTRRTTRKRAAAHSASTATVAPTPATSEEDKKQEAFDLVLATIDALLAERGAEDKIWGSMVKQTLKRRSPGFNEAYYGFRSFNKLLEEAAQRRLIGLERDDKSGGYVIHSPADGG
jgi:uncharacterized protein (TIGR00288 family)